VAVGVDGEELLLTPPNLSDIKAGLALFTTLFSPLTTS
jgi:hypothetical protein